VTYQVHGEVTADGSRIALVAASEHTEQVIEAARLLQTLTPLVRPSDPPGAVTLALSWPAVVQLAHTFADAWRPGPRLAAWTAAEFARRSSGLDTPLTVGLPPGLTPRPYQVAGAQLIAAVGSVLLTDEPGTGKTITTILGLLERQRRTGRIAPVLVVCPASVVDAWVTAWRSWAPQCTTVAWRGAKATRARLAGRAHVYVVSYDTARNDAAGPGKGPAPLLALAPASLVIDECHLIKSSDARRSHAVRRLAKAAHTVVALSGTPITHHPGDLWPTLATLCPQAWPSKERWVARYCHTVTGDYTSTVLGLAREREPEFRTALLGGHRRVAKADVLAQLPPKVYSVRTVALPAAWRRVYDDMQAQMLARLPDDGGELSVMSVLAQLTRLSQLASAAADVTLTTERGADGEDREHVSVTLKAPSWKVDALLEVLAERPGQPVVVFAPSRQLIQLAGRAAAEAGHRVGYVVGGQGPRERTETVAAFQHGALDLLCVTTGAGGVGITLTAAGTAVFLQRPWSLVEALQAEDRLHRIGAEVHECVEVIDVVAANTIDTRIRAVLRDKAGQLADLVQDRRVVTELLGGATVPRPTARRAA
jgi:SNF2 family DNA or RNA helicase